MNEKSNFSKLIADIVSFILTDISQTPISISAYYNFAKVVVGEGNAMWMVRLYINSAPSLHSLTRGEISSKMTNDEIQAAFVGIYDRWGFGWDEF